MKLRVMTYNVRYCRTFLGSVRPERIAETMSDYHADVIALQEVDVNRRRSHYVDQPKLIAEKLGMHYSFQPSLRHGQAQYGTAILSRFPFVLEEKQRSDTKRGKKVLTRPSIHRVQVMLGEGKICDVVNVHLHWHYKPRKKDVEMILQNGWIDGDANQPLILMGDFNATRSWPSYEALKKKFPFGIHQTPVKPMKTWWSLLPCRSLDHIWVSGHIKIEKVFVANTSKLRVLSDHLPVVADIII